MVKRNWKNVTLSQPVWSQYKCECGLSWNLHRAERFCPQQEHQRTQDKTLLMTCSLVWLCLKFRTATTLMPRPWNPKAIKTQLEEKHLGSNLFFLSLLLFKKSHLSNFCSWLYYIGVRNRSILREATGPLGNFGLLTVVLAWVSGCPPWPLPLVPLQPGWHVPLSQHCATAPFPALWPRVSGSAWGTNHLRLTHRVLEQQKGCRPSETLLPRAWERQRGEICFWKAKQAPASWYL